VDNERGNLTLTNVIVRGNEASTSQDYYAAGGGLDNDDDLATAPQPAGAPTTVNSSSEKVRSSA
jgi:hypothetical protein